ncbi:hypothetical protein [Paenibacillus agricola]|uniref:Uncharacterized protein n=1 Tax=Paenibacillus agricola TaxID=2716264 RepID=A0ABX0J8W1_9BACL|nr:hypothetical protein [Paenibacillus agricola]NHN32872.1 hypothetical protein [Paenibacillus agricola]
MQSIIYILLGTTDILVILLLIFKIFRWPFLTYIKELFFIAFICSIESYIARMVMNIPQWDLILQVIILIFSLRYLLRVNYYHALTLTVIGTLAYSEIAYTVFNILNYIGITTNNEASESIGFGVFATQILSECMGIAVSWILYKFNLGFSFVAVPPHDPKRTLSNYEQSKLIINFGCVLIVSTAMFWLMNYGMVGVNILMIGDFLALLVLLYLAQKEDYSF